MLRENQNLRVIVLEAGCAQGILWNRYINGLDDSLLGLIMDSLNGTASGTREHADFFLWLKDYNMSLAPECRLTVMGMDIDHQWEPVQILLSEKIAQSGQFSEELRILLTTDFATLQGMATHINTIDEILPVSTDPNINLILFSWKQRLLLYSNQRPWDERDLVMFDLFKSQYSSFAASHRSEPSFSLFGEWGSYHTQQKDAAGHPRLAALITTAASAELPDVPADLISVDLRYFTSKTFWRSGKNPLLLDQPSAKEMFSILSAGPDKILILDVRLPGSPFFRDSRLDDEPGLNGYSAERYTFVIACCGSASCISWK